VRHARKHGSRAVADALREWIDDADLPVLTAIAGRRIADCFDEMDLPPMEAPK
jgi:hypothetical protein